MNTILRNVFENSKIRTVLELFGIMVAAGPFGKTNRLICSLLGPSVTLAKWKTKN
jgi:hypothetical protein